MRIAFLTPEYVLDYPSSGGLASYVARMAQTLAMMGHHAEVLTLSDHPRVVDHNGVRVEHVVPATGPALRLLRAHWCSRLLLGGTIKNLSGARALAGALKRREQAVDFDLVQSSDYGLSGACVSKRANRIHVMRCSWSRKLYQQHAGLKDSMDSRIVAWHEHGCFRRADIVYAPSRFMADALSQEFGVPVGTMRPPLMPPPPITLDKPAHLPNRYMIHFGQLSRIKGTDIVAEALRAVWQWAPDFHLVMAGRVQSGEFIEQVRRNGGRHAKQVHWMGSVPRDRLYAMVRHAQAAILPSRCDNLPNTVIESLCLGVPVIGSDGASINELVTHNQTGKLVSIEDASALAGVIIEQWRQPLRFTSVTLKQQETFVQMAPDFAAASLLGLVKKPSAPRLMKAA